jgi:DNA-binding NarL/FixJ family response regulator
LITLIIADDDEIIRQGLTMILGTRKDMKLLGAAANGLEAVRLCRELRPDVAVLDIRMPELDGIAATRTILSEKISAPLLLTTFDEPALIAEALMAGARGYILKSAPAEGLLSAIVSVSEGGTVFAPDVIEYIRTMLRPPDGNDFFAELTVREREIVSLVAEGLSNSQIAKRLFLSGGTVRNHISAILEKTGLEHRTQIAVRYYCADN